MSTKSKLFAIAALFALVISNACSKDDNPNQPAESPKYISSFVIEASKNGLTQSAVGIIGENTINISTDEWIDNSKALIATFSGKGAVSVGGVAQVSGVTPNDFSKDVVYTVTGDDGSKKDYTVKLKLSSQKDIAAFSFETSKNSGLKKTLTGVVAENGVLIEAIDWLNSPMLVATFTAKGKVTVNGITQTSGVTANDFSKDVVYTITAADGTTKNYTIKIITPLSAGLPVLKINTQNSAPILNKEDYVQATFKILGANTEAQNIEGNLEIRGRGNSTWGLPKKPYRIKFASKTGVFGLYSEKSWTLLANYIDKTLMRNDIAFQISKVMEMKFTPSTNFVNVYLNDEFLGCYHMSDQIEVSKNRVNVPEQSKTASTPDELSGGYLIEIDGFANSEPVMFTTGKGVMATVKYPKDDEINDAQKDYIKTHTQKFEDALFAANFADPANGYRKYLDLASFVNYYIISEFSGNPDCFWSTYMYKLKSDDKLYTGPVWDFDIAFDNDTRLGEATNKLMKDYAHDPKTWIAQLMKDPTFKKAVKDRWNVKKADLQAIVNKVTEDAALLNESQKWNFKVWNFATTAHVGKTPLADYNAEVQRLKTYLQNRYTFLDQEFNKW